MFTQTPARLLTLISTLLPLPTWADSVVSTACTLNDIPLHGKVQVVENFPDLKVQIVTSFPDLKVQIVENFPDKCGQWQMVAKFPDFKIQFVESFPDLKIQYVTSFPGRR